MDNWIVYSLSIIFVTIIVNFVMPILLKKIRSRWKWVSKYDRMTIFPKYPTTEWVSWPKENVYVALILTFATLPFFLLSLLSIISIISNDTNMNFGSLLSPISLFLLFLILDYIMLRTVLVKFRITSEAVERYSFRNRHKSFRWGDIRDIWYNKDISSRHILIKTSKGMFWVSTEMQGIGLFSSSILDNVPSERLERARSKLRSLSDYSSPIPSKKERKEMRRKFSKI